MFNIKTQSVYIKHKSLTREKKLHPYLNNARQGKERVQNLLLNFLKCLLYQQEYFYVFLLVDYF